MAYLNAYNQLAPLRPIPFTELEAYYDRMRVPLDFEVFIRVMRGLESDDAMAEKESNEKMAKAQKKQRLPRR